MISPDSSIKQIVQLLQAGVQDDIKFASLSYKGFGGKNLDSITEQVLDPGKFQSFLQTLFTQRSTASKKATILNLPNITGQTNLTIQLDRENALQQLSSMHAQTNRRFLMPMLYYLNRQFRQVTQGLYVEEPGIERLRKLLAKGERVILLPQYKSFLDQFIILYTLAYYNIEIPFTVGNYEDTPRVRFLDICLRRVGYLLAKRSREQSFQEKYVT